jgi:hypothetical protein
MRGKNKDRDQEGDPMPCLPSWKGTGDNITEESIGAIDAVAWPLGNDGEHAVIVAIK